MDKVIEILSQFEATVNSEFNPFIIEIQGWITAVIAIAFLLYITFSVAIPMLNGKDFDISKLMTMLMLFGMFKMYPTLIKSVDNFFQVPSKSAMDGVKSEMQSITITLEQKRNAPPTAEKDVDYTELPGAVVAAISNSTQRLPIMLYSLILTMGLYILFAILVLIKLSSVVAANIIMVLGSIPFALSFLPGFSGGVPSVIKNLLAVRLWPFVGAMIFKVILKLGLVSEIISQVDKLQQMIVNPTQIQSWNYDFSPIILMIVGMFLLLMTPKFVDMGLNVSTSAGAGNLMGASSMVGGITNFMSSGLTTAAQSAMGIGDGGQQKSQNQLLSDISQGIQDLGKNMSNMGTGGSGDASSSNGQNQGADKTTLSNTQDLGNDK